MFHFTCPEPIAATSSSAIRWCAVGATETQKCDAWVINSMTENGAIMGCPNAATVDGCLKKIMVKHPLIKTQHLGLV